MNKSKSKSCKRPCWATSLFLKSSFPLSVCWGCALKGSVCCQNNAHLSTRHKSNAGNCRVRLHTAQVLSLLGLDKPQLVWLWSDSRVIFVKKKIHWLSGEDALFISAAWWVCKHHGVPTQGGKASLKENCAIISSWPFLPDILIHFHFHTSKNAALATTKNFAAGLLLF